MSIDLTNLSRKELEKLGRNVEKQLEKLKKKDLKKARDAAAKAAAAMGFTLDEVLGDTPAKTPRPSKPKTKSKPKYANPSDPTQKWTGKGRQPQWFKDAMQAGTPPESLEI